MDNFNPGSNAFNSISFAGAGYSITANSALALGAGGINAMAGGVVDTLTGNLTLTANESFTAGAGAALSVPGAIDNLGFTLTVGGSGSTTLGGIISGSGGLTKTNPGTLTLGSANVYSGPTSVNNGVVILGVANALPTSTALTLGALTSSGVVNLNGNNQVLLGAGVSGTGSANALTNSSATGAILTLLPTSPTTTSAAITGNLSLVKDGSSIETLSGASTYTGTTTILNGTLALGASNVLPSTTLLVTGNTNANSGTLDLAGTSQTVAALGVSGNGTANTITDSSTTPSTLTVAGPGASTYAGKITGPLSVVEAGTGTLFLSGGSANTFTGGVNATSGVLVSLQPGSLGSGASTLNGGTLTLGPSAVTGFDGNGADWTVNSTTIVGVPITNNVLTLTDNNNSEARSAFLNELVQPTNGFTATFTYQAGGNKAADGVAFVLQNDPRGASALGAAGGSLGYAGITNSAAVELNIFTGAAGGIGTDYAVNGAIPTTTPVNPVSLGSGDAINVTLTYSAVAQTIVETLTDPTASTTQTVTFSNVNLQAGLAGSSAWMGFTGATGGLNASQTISNFTYTPATASSSYGENLQTTAGTTSTLTILAAAGNPAVAASGNLTLATGSTLNVTADPTIPANQSYGLAVQGNVSLTANSNLAVANNGTGAGTVTIGGILSGTGAITGAGNVVVTGSVAPGTSGANSTGVLNTDNLTLAAASSYNVELAGGGVGQFDQLNVTGTATITGSTLNVSSLNGFTPTPGQTFDILQTSGGVIGQFAQGASVIGGNTPYTITYNANNVILTAGTSFPATHFLVSAATTTTAGSAITVTVTALDAGNFRAGGYSGTVQITSTDGQAVLPGNSTLTNGLGTFTVTLKTAGSKTITATDTSSGITGSATVMVSAAAPAQITVASGAGQAATVNTSFASPLVATVLDPYNNPVSGVSVTFAAPGSGASGTFPGGATLTTGVNGQVSDAIMANTTAGAYSVTATATGVSTPASFSLSNTAGAAASVTVASGANQSATVNTTFSSALVVLVADQYGNPVSGVNVTFAAPGSGAGATFPSGATAATGSNGQASETVKANTTAGAYTISASVSGVSTPASFSLSNTAGTANSITVTAGSSQFTTVNTLFGNALVAMVTDQYGNPVSGVSVTFAAPGSGASATFPNGATATTAGNGQVSDSVKANTVAGMYSVTATASGVSTPATFTLINTAGAASTISAASGAGQSATVNSSFASGLTATVTDQYGNPVSGVSVTFAAPGSGASGHFSNSNGGIGGTTNAIGQLTESFTANTVAGTYSVTATVSGVSTPASFSLTNTAGAASIISVTAGAGQSALVNTTFASALTATVTDQYGNPLSGVNVTFAAPGSGPSATFPGGAVVATGSNGQASDSVKANTAAGNYSVTATAAGVTTPGAFSLTNTAGAASIISVTAGAGQSATVNTAFANALTATVTDQYGNPLSGVNVTFAAPGSGASANFPGGVIAATLSNGQASEIVTANTAAGNYSVTATAAGVTTSASFSLTNTAGAANSITVASGSGQSATVNTSFASALTATVTDQYGNPVSGASVTFAAPGSGASGHFSNSNGGIGGTTNSSGQVSESFTANTTAGSYSVAASVAGAATPASFSLSNTAGAPASITVVSGAGQSATVNTTFGSALAATVADQYGNPLSGVTVAFAAPGSGASAVFPSGTTATTGSNGQAADPVTANTVAGSYSVTASVSGISTPATFSLTNTPGSANSIVTTSGAARTPRSTPLSAALWLRR